MVFSAAAVLRCRALQSRTGGIIRSLRHYSSAGTPTYSLAAAAKLTSTNKSATVPPMAPWLKIKPPIDEHDGSRFKFYSLTDEKIHSFFAYEEDEDDEGFLPPIGEIVGSSQGWLVMYHWRNHGVILSDPTTDRTVTLPSIGGVLHRLIVVEKERLAVAAAGSGGRLALCRPRQSTEWTPFPSGRVYDSLTYSSHHSRLFCITRDGDGDGANSGSDLEIWDLQVEREGEAPKLEWKMDLDSKSMPDPPDLKKLKYVACAEHSGEVYMVERHITFRHGLSGRFVDDAAGSECIADSDAYEPYRTTSLKVYKVDRERRRLIRMKGSLDGLAIFIGLNEPMAILASEVGGVKPDSIYFTYDRRIRYKGNRYMDDEVGRLDYPTGNFSKPGFIYNIDPEFRRDLMWFAPPNI